MKVSLASNPVRQARVSLGLTQEAFAEKCHIQTQVVYLTESGTYKSIPPSILNYLKEEGEDTSEIAKEYDRFVTLTRLQTAHTFDWADTIPDGYTLTEHPFVTYRKYFNLSRQGISKMLCVQPGLLYRLETGKIKQLPGQLVDALRFVGVRWETINMLNLWTERYYWS